MKRSISLILALALALSLVPAALAAESGPEDSAGDDTPVAVTVSVYSNLHGQEALPGLVVGKSFYMAADMLAYLTDGMLLPPTKDSPVRFSCFSGGLEFGFDFDDSDVIPMLEYDGEIYLSAPHFLRFMGFGVSFGEKPGDSIHMYVYRQYTVLDAWMEFTSDSMYRFNISEAYSDNNPLLFLSALDTVIFGYDSNLLRYVVDGATVEKQVYLDSLTRILKTDCGTDEWDVYTSIFHTENDFASMEADLPGFLDYMSTALGGSEYNIGVLNEALGISAFDGVSFATGMASDLVGAAETFKAFYNLQDLQKKLLRDTLCTVDRDDELYGELPALFRAANEAKKMMDGVLDENVAKDVFVNLWKTAWSIAGGGPAAAWSLGTSMVKDLPDVKNILDKEESISFATICSDIVSITSCLGSRPITGMFVKVGDVIPSKRLREGQDTMRSAMALSLMAGISARDALIPTGWVSRERTERMESVQYYAKRLLERVISAQPATPGTQSKIVVEEDLSWMAGLSGGCGTVVEYCGDAYYWKYSSKAFSDQGSFGSFSPYMADDNALVRRNMQTGEEETLLTGKGSGTIAIAGGRIFYCDVNSDVCSMYLDGTDSMRHGHGALLGVSTDGTYVIFGLREIGTINTMTLKTRIIVSDADPVIVWNGVIYYETWSDETLAYDGKLTLSRIMPDGTGRLDLYTTKPDLYTDSFPMGDYACVAQIYFSEDYIYFSYGSTAGSGSFFQGGRVVRVNYDGSGGEVVSRMDKLCGSDFEVAPDGTVTCHYESSDFYMLYSSLEKFRIMDGSVWWYDRTSGNL